MATPASALPGAPVLRRCQSRELGVRAGIPAVHDGPRAGEHGPAPLQATHQELALANARHLSQYVALNYFGVPGLDVGGAVFTGKAEQAPGTVGDSRVTLWKVTPAGRPASSICQRSMRMARSAT